jgi:hypothetical protein
LWNTAFRRRHQGQEDDLVVGHAALLQHVDSVDRRVAGGDHRIAEDEGTLDRIRQAHQVFDRLVGFGIAEHADVADARRRHQFQQAVAHADAGAQDRHDGQLLAGDDRRVDRHQRGFDLAGGQRQVARDLIAHQQRDLPEQLAEGAGRRSAVAHVRQLVLDKRVIQDVQAGKTRILFHCGYSM